MSTIFDVLERLYPLINTSTINALIDGDIYKFNKPLNSELRDIVITSLPLRDGEEMVSQPGTVFINIYSKDQSGNRVDSAFLNLITDAVESRIRAFDQGATYLVLEIASTNVFKDPDQTTMSYSSIRLNVFTE